MIHSDFLVCFVKLLHKVGLNLSLCFSNTLHSSNLESRRKSTEQKIKGFLTLEFSLNSFHAVSGSFNTCYLPFFHCSPWKSTANQVTVSKNDANIFMGDKKRENRVSNWFSSYLFLVPLDFFLMCAFLSVFTNSFQQVCTWSKAIHSTCLYLALVSCYSRIKPLLQIRR